MDAVIPDSGPHTSDTIFLTAKAPARANPRLSAKTAPAVIPNTRKNSARRTEYPGSITAVGVSTGARPNM